MFLDESGFSLKPSVYRTWAPCGETPILQQLQRSWTKLNQITALSLSPKRRKPRLFWQWHGGKGIKQDTFIGFIRHLLSQLKGPVMVVMDNLRVHKSKRFQAYAKKRQRLYVEYLPAYAPELNPCELVFADSKRATANHTCAQLEALSELADNHMLNRQASQDHLKGYLKGVPYAIL